MNDLILKSYVDDFTQRYGHKEIKTSIQFEYFAAHCLIAKDYQGHFDAAELSLGEANGIDSMAVFVNGVLLESAAEVKALARQDMDVRFVFIQTKTSGNYDQGDVLKFTQAVRTFFSQPLQNSNNHELQDWLEIKDEIYKHAIRFIENPKVDMFYVTSSGSQPNSLIQTTKNNEIKVLTDLNLFSEINFKFIDAEELKSIYRTLSNKITKQINFDKFTILPKIHGVKRAFIGILPCKEYLRLICDEDGHLLKNVFYDNVRDFQGKNSVNQEILSTITAEEFGPEIFVLLNNGVTVVSKSVNPVGSEFTVRDFQVVNGCQTSHILHQNEKLLSGKEFITIKLIETEDVDLTNKITKATNRQTEVKLEAFAGLQPFHKELEAFYASFSLDERLYYERRPGQYDFDSSIPHGRIISIPSQIKSFVSVFLEEPQKIHFYYGQLLQDYSSGDESVLFSETHDPYPYYLASKLSFLVSEKLKRKDKDLKKWRHHLATMVRMLIAGPFNRSRLSDSAFCKRYCDALLSNVNKFDEHYEQALSILKTTLENMKKGSNWDRNINQDGRLVEKLLSICRDSYFAKAKKSESSISNEEFDFNGIFIGTILNTVPEKKFGHISYGQRRFFFKEHSTFFKTNQKVRFKVRKNGDSVEAFDVEALS